MSAVDLNEPLARGPLTTRSKTVDWQDPAVLAAAGAALPGREFLQATIDGRRVAFAEAHARDQSGELVGHATTSLALNQR
jgi:hypothetical protein